MNYIINALTMYHMMGIPLKLLPMYKDTEQINGLTTCVKTKCHDFIFYFIQSNARLKVLPKKRFKIKVNFFFYINN